MWKLNWECIKTRGNRNNGEIEQRVAQVVAVTCGQLCDARHGTSRKHWGMVRAADRQSEKKRKDGMDGGRRRKDRQKEGREEKEKRLGFRMGVARLREVHHHLLPHLGE